MTHFEYLLEQAANLIAKGEATVETAFQLAIQQDNERTINCINALSAPNKQTYGFNQTAVNVPITAKDKDWLNAIDVISGMVHRGINSK